MMHNKDNSWLLKLKAGDRVIEDRSLYGSTNWNIVEVTRTTNTTIIITAGSFSRKFRKSDGLMLAGDKWHSVYLLELTPERNYEILCSKLRLKANKLLKDFDVKKVPIERIREIIEVLQKPIDTKNDNDSLKDFNVKTLIQGRL
jgi:hypothetical protein